MDKLKEGHLSTSPASIKISSTPPLIDTNGFLRVRSTTSSILEDGSERKEMNLPKIYGCYELDNFGRSNSCLPLSLTISEDNFESSNTGDYMSDSPRNIADYFTSNINNRTCSTDTINTPDLKNSKKFSLENPGWRMSSYEFDSIFSESKTSALRRVTSVDLSNDVQLAKSSLFDQSRRNSFCMNDKFLGRVFCAPEISVEEVIGEGFFGRVYKIVERSTNKILVMKELKCADYRAQKQFITEIELVRHLDHPNLVKFIGVVFMNKKISVILEYIEFGTLRKLIKDFMIDLSEKNKIKIALDIATGMSYLHSKKIVHRDLTSKNCLIRDIRNFDVVVSDFGLSRVIHRIPSFVPTKQPMKLETVGTAFWMAPEMLMGFDYDHNVDIFSFGIVTCELLGRTSAHPDDIPRLNNFGLDEKGFMDKIRNILNPPLLISIAIKCCRVNPSTRPSFIGIRHSLQRRFDIDYCHENSNKKCKKHYLLPVQHANSLF